MFLHARTGPPGNIGPAYVAEVGQMTIDYLYINLRHVMLATLFTFKKSVGSRVYTFFLKPLEKSRCWPRVVFLFFFLISLSIDLKAVQHDLGFCFTCTSKYNNWSWFRWRVRKGILRVCFYFCFHGTEFHVFSLPLKGSEGNSEVFCSAEQPEFRRK